MSISKKLIGGVLLFIMVAGCESVVDEPAPQAQDERLYKKSIERIAEGDFEATLIEKAEGVYPPRDSVVASVPEIVDLKIPEAGYWYYSHFDGVLIPYAITKEAVSYYSNLFDSVETGESYQFLRQIEYIYTADVSFESEFVFDGRQYPREWTEVTESFANVYVVTMALDWVQNCGELCAMWIKDRRVVVFDRSGNVVRVFLDGPFPVVVS